MLGKLSAEGTVTAPEMSEVLSPGATRQQIEDAHRDSYGQPPGLTASSEMLFTPYVLLAARACGERNWYGLDRVAVTRRPAASMVSR
jgi:hypothetical protein